jgi:hypothetical protein
MNWVSISQKTTFFIVSAVKSPNITPSLLILLKQNNGLADAGVVVSLMRFEGSRGLSCRPAPAEATAALWQQADSPVAVLSDLRQTPHVCSTFR